MILKTDPALLIKTLHYGDIMSWSWYKVVTSEPVAYTQASSLIYSLSVDIKVLDRCLICAFNATLLKVLCKNIESHLKSLLILSPALYIIYTLWKPGDLLKPLVHPTPFLLCTRLVFLIWTNLWTVTPICESQRGWRNGGPVARLNCPLTVVTP